MRPLLARGKSVLFDAVGHFNNDDGWAMASHLAISALTALFPFLIFVTNLAGFLGAGALSSAAVELIFDTWPDQIAAPIAEEVHKVLTGPRSGYLAFSLAAAAFFASNGVEALRTALNRAYRVSETRSFLFRRLQSLVFILIATPCFLAVSILIVLAPLVASFSERHAPWLAHNIDSSAVLRYLVAAAVIVVTLFAVHVWLPDGKRTLRQILPGIAVTLGAWVAGSFAFAFYIEHFSAYTATYAGLASIMAAIVFLYLMSLIFILGGEINAAVAGMRDARGR